MDSDLLAIVIVFLLVILIFAGIISLAKSPQQSSILLEKEKKQRQQDDKSQKKIHKPIQEAQIGATEPSSSDLGARLKKLRQMYKDGILSKVEFEKAKNKLLK